MKHVRNSEEIEIGISGIRKLTETLKTRHNFDLGIYASTSLKRRVAKTLIINELATIDELIDRLEASHSFFHQFMLQMTVSGTEFFRDPAFWRYFRDEICKIVSRNHMRIKIWIPGCSTGEEIISTAIVLTEAGIYDKSVIIATDFNEKIIDNCKNKEYSNHMLEMSENNYRRFREDEGADLGIYIEKTKNGFTFDQNIFRNVEYHVYDREENFKIKGFNVVICRNNFIYFTAKYQEMLLEVITKRLSANGYFAIGNKENISFCKDASKFTLLNASEKVYKKTGL